MTRLEDKAARVRNPEAVCGTCPYQSLFTLEFGTWRVCKRHAPIAGDGDPFPWTDDDQWCGEHPDFFKEITHE